MSAQPAPPRLRTAAPAAVAERRDSQRFDCQLTAVCQPVAAEFHWEGQADDISAGGISLVLSRRFEPGTLLAVGLKGLALDSSCMPLARVCRVNPAGLYWRLGCSWADELGLDELRGLLGAYTIWKTKAKQRIVA
jgi:hypothetical protein